MAHLMNCCMGRTRDVCILACLVACLASCGEYEVKLNENTLYTPPARPVDEALAGCLEARTELAIGHCASLGIESLTGVVQYSELLELDLSNNAIRSAAPLADLNGLQRVDLRGNSQLDCGTLARVTAEVVAPAHCNQQSPG